MADKERGQATDPDLDRDEEWDDIPETEVFSWGDKPGTVFTGTIREMFQSSKYKGKLLRALDDEGKPVIVPAPSKLEQAILDNDLIGKRVRIRFVEVEKVAGGNLKHFSIRVAKRSK